MKRLLAVNPSPSFGGLFRPSNEEKEMANLECPKFIKSEMNAYDAKVFDIYSKKGKVVAEVGYKQFSSPGDSYSVRLCILDREKGTISSPSPLNDSEWKK